MHTHPTGAAPMPAWSPFSNAHEMSEFRRLVEAHLQISAPDSEWELGALTLDTDDGPATAGLLNLADLCAGNPGERWEEIVGWHFSAIQGEAAKNSMAMMRDFGRAKSALRLRVQPMGLINAYGPIHRPMGSELGVAVALSIPDGCATLGRLQTDAWRVDDDEIFDIAKTNTLKRVRRRVSVKRTREGTFTRHGGSGLFVSGHLCVVETLIPEELRENGVLVAIPTPREFLTLGLNGTKQKGDFIALARYTVETFNKGPNSLSPSVLFWHPDHGFHDALCLGSQQVTPNDGPVRSALEVALDLWE